MHSLINNCCETNFHLLCMVLRLFIRHNTTELFLFFYCTWNIKWHSTQILNKSTAYDLQKS